MRIRNILFSKWCGIKIIWGGIVLSKQQSTDNRLSSTNEAPQQNTGVSGRSGQQQRVMRNQNTYGNAAIQDQINHQETSGENYSIGPQPDKAMSSFGAAPEQNDSTAIAMSSEEVLCEAEPNADAILDELRFALAQANTLIPQVRSTSTSTLQEITNALQEVNRQISFWYNQETRTMNHEFADQISAEYSSSSGVGDIVGVASALNLANPEPISKLIIGGVLIVASFGIRDFGRHQQETRNQMYRRIQAANMRRMDSATSIRQSSSAEMLNAHLEGSVDVTEFAWSGGFMEGLTYSIRDSIEDLESECGNPEANGRTFERELTQARNILDIYHGLANQIHNSLQRMPTLPEQIRTTGRETLNNTIERYIEWLAESGNIKLSGQVVWDEQSGGESLRLTIEELLSIGDTEARYIGAQTKAKALQQPSDLLMNDILIELDALTAVHTYETAPGTGAYDLPAGVPDGPGAPISFTGEDTFMISSTEATLPISSFVGDRIPLNRLHEEFMGGE